MCNNNLVDRVCCVCVEEEIRLTPLQEVELARNYIGTDFARYLAEIKEGKAVWKQVGRK